MADAIDALEERISETITDPSILDAIYRTIDAWRDEWGGNSPYVAKKSKTRRKALMERLLREGKSAKEAAQVAGTSLRQAQRVKSKTSSYL